MELRRPCLAAALALATWLAGCGRGRKPEDYVPPAETARRQLSHALGEWREGRVVEGWEGPPAVRFADSRAQAGRGLADFEILGELPVDSGRRFQVRLKMRDPDETLNRQYVVFGIDPLWVVEQDDLNMITHWDHAMMPEQGAAPAGDASPPASP